MSKYRNVDIFIFGLLVVLICTLLITYFLIKSEGSECISDGFVYAAKSFYKQTGSALQCSCMTNDSSIVGFVFDETGNRTPTMTATNERRDLFTFNVNLSQHKQ